MKVVAATPLYPPDSRVGAWLATHGHLRRLATAGHEVDVVRVQTRPGPTYEHEGVTVHTAEHLEQQVEQADVVISHLGDNGKAALAARLHGKPLVRMVHSANGSNLARRLDGAALAVFNSYATRDAVGWTGPSIVAHPPLPSKGAHGSGRSITLVNLSEDKGGRHFDLLCKRMPDRHFLGVKGGYGRQVLRERTNLTVASNTDDMEADVWSKTRILVVPSLHEAWSMTAVEALAHGIPVVAHPTPGLRESIADAGIFIDRRDIPAWIAELERLGSDAEWEAASEASARRFDELTETINPGVFRTAIEALG